MYYYLLHLIFKPFNAIKIWENDFWVENAKSNLLNVNGSLQPSLPYIPEWAVLQIIHILS